LVQTASHSRRTIDFPNRPVGTIYLWSKDYSGRSATATRYATAQGLITIPQQAIIELADVPVAEAESLEFLSNLQPDALQHLHLSNEPVSDKGLAAISKLKGLQCLNLDGTDVTDAGLVHLDLPVLSALSLKDTKVTNEGVSHIAASLGTLNLLVLRGTQITDKSAPSIGLLGRLEALDLSHTEITDDGLAEIAHLSPIHKLSLAADNITDAGIEHVCRSERLEVLDLNQTKITDSAVDALSKMRQLVQLNVYKTLVTANGIARLRKALPECHVYDRPTNFIDYRY
jgi:Leucine Rich repeat